MTAALPLPATAGQTARTGFKDQAAFLTSVLVFLTFTQCWVMPLTGPNGDAEASTLIRTLYFPVYAAALVLAVAGWRETLFAAVRAPLLWMLIALVFISTLWSIDPSVTVRRGVALLFTTLAGLALASRYDWPRLVEVFAVALAITAAACFVFGAFVPSYGRMTDLFPGAWRGVWFEKNGLGDNMTVACIVFAAAAILIPKRRWLWGGMIGLALTLILLSTSKTSLVSLVIGMGALVFVVLAKRGPALSVIVTFVGVTVLGVLGVTIYFASDVFFALLGKDATLTGRTKLWAGVLNQVHTRPWTGFGYAAVWNDTSIWGPLAWISKQAKFVATHAHNSWLEVWLGLGYVGLALWVLFFAEAWIRSFAAAYRSPAGYFALPFLVVYSLMTLTESVAIVYNDFIWVMFVAVAVKLAVPSRSTTPAAASRFAAPSP
jgi:exopolysaccharide production protein ExoQ